MNRRFALPTFIWLIPLALLLFAGITWLNFRFTSKGEGAIDFLPGWTGTRLFLTEGLSPYSQETTAEIRKLANGSSPAPEEGPLVFNYPMYAILVFAPFALVGSFELAAALWMSALELSLLLICLTGVYLSRWQVRRWLILVLLVFSISWYPSLRALIDGNPSIICSLLLVGAFWAIYQEQDALAAILLALATFKPQMVLVVIPFIMIWGGSKKRPALVWGFLGVLVLLTAATTLLIPDWIVQYTRLILEQIGKVEIGTPRALFMYWIPGVGKQLAWLLTIICGAFLIWEWRLAAGMNYRWFLWAAFFSLAMTNLIGIPTSVENQVALLPALILVLAVWDERWGNLGRWLIGSSLVILSIGLWWIGILTERKDIPPDLAPLIFFSVPVFIILGLYWVRWWAIRSTRLPLQDITERLG